MKPPVVWAFLVKDPKHAVLLLMSKKLTSNSVSGSHKSSGSKAKVQTEQSGGSIVAFFRTRNAFPSSSFTSFLEFFLRFLGDLSAFFRAHNLDLSLGEIWGEG